MNIGTLFLNPVIISIFTLCMHLFDGKLIKNGTYADLKFEDIPSGAQVT